MGDGIVSLWPGEDISTEMKHSVFADEKLRGEVVLRLELLQGLDLVWSLLITWRCGTLSLTFLPCVCLRRRRSSLVQLLWCKFSKKSQPRFGLEGSYRPAVSPPPSHSCSTDSPSAFDCIGASIRMSEWNGIDFLHCNAPQLLHCQESLGT